MSHSRPPRASQLTLDDIDDLIYACRTNDLTSLKENLPCLASQRNCSEADIINGAIDVDEEGLGSRACLLHYPAANGSLEVVEYLLGILGSQVRSGEPQVNGNGTGHTQSALLVNHRNVSGNTPLHWAALNGHIEIVKALVKAGADPAIVNEAGRDAVVEAEYSSQVGAEECANWLLKECEGLEKGPGVGGGEGGGGSADVEDVEEGEKTEAAKCGEPTEGP